MPSRNSANTRGRVAARIKREAAIKALVEGHNWQEVASIAGYASTGSAHTAVMEYLKQNPSQDADELRKIENLKLNDLERETRKILQRLHIVINTKGIVGRYTGRIMRDESGDLMYTEDSQGRTRPVYEIEELQDDDPALRAIATLLRIYERRSKLNGTDRPVVIKFEDEDGLDEEIEGLIEALQHNQTGIPKEHDG
jgi:hypothetical protein